MRWGSEHEEEQVELLRPSRVDALISALSPKSCGMSWHFVFQVPFFPKTALLEAEAEAMQRIGLGHPNAKLVLGLLGGRAEDEWE